MTARQHARLHALSAFATVLRTNRMSRPRFERWQARAMNRWLRQDLPQVDFYRNAGLDLAALPVIEKADVMGTFEAFNRDRITAAEGWAAFAANRPIGSISVGASTGTSGNRALYLVTPQERYRWLGTMLAKMAPGFLWQPERVAVILPQASDLYEGANHVGPLRLQFYNLNEGPEAWTEALTDFAPTTIIAPPRVLRLLAESASGLTPRRLFAGAETLDPTDRRIIESRFGLPLGQVYMATEGLFGVSCAHGRLHLAEESVFFEFQPFGDGLVSPLVTGFRRTLQIMARYRMNDLLRLSDAPCPCGSPLRVIDEVVGRMDDSFAFGDRLVTPDVLRNAVLDAAREIDDFRILREGEARVALVLEPEVAAPAAEAALAALKALFARRGIDLSVTLRREVLRFEPGRKLRRVESRWRAA
jgi:phenylacetate-CoA ligase